MYAEGRDRMNALACARAQIIQSAKDDRFGGTNFCARRRETALLAIITESAFEGAAGVRQRLRTAINYPKGTRHHAVSAAVTDIILHKYRADFGADDRSGGTRFEATGFLAMLANVREKNPAERIVSITIA